MTPGPQTESELLFEKYLTTNGYDDFEFEPTFPGKSRHPDYLLRWQQRELIFEVKERRRKPDGPDTFHCDPMAGIREEINEAYRKFREFKDFSRSLVIYNAGDADTLLTPEWVFGAMLGDPGFTIALDVAAGALRHETGESVFLPKRGKMIRYKTGEMQNKTINAIVILEWCHFPNPAFEDAVAEATRVEERRLGQELTHEERAVLMWDLVPGFRESGRGPTGFKAPRVVVCENPGAARQLPRTRQLPRNFMCGPFDERWAIVDGHLRPMYAGERVREIEASSVSEEICLMSN